MTDAQLGAILTAITVAAGILGTAIRWSAGRIIKALDANSESNIGLTARLAEFTVRLEDVSRFVEEHTPVNQPIPTPGRKTPARGVALSEYAVHRPRTRGDGE